MTFRILSACAVLGGALAVWAEELPPLPEGEDCFTIATFGDTQVYQDNGDGTVSNPSFESRVNWLADAAHVAAQNILFVSHLGDIVNTRSIAAEWAFADAQMARLDAAGVPNAIAPGNHDVTSKGISTDFQKYFPASRYAGKSWYGGSFAGTGTGIFDNNSNSYQLFSWKGQDYIIFHLQCNAGQAVLDWVNNLLSGAYAAHKAIIVTHQYLGAVTKVSEGVCGEPSQRLIRRMQWGKITANGSLNPTEAWNYCFRRHPNILMILSGDQSAALACHRTAIGLYGNVVHEIVTDYPHADDSDWIRLYRFFPKTGNIEVYTYSPQRNSLCTSAGYCKEERFHRFTMTFDVADEASVADVLVRQEWPRDARIRVDYTVLNGTSALYDVQVSATVGETPVIVPANAVSGQTTGLRSGAYTLFLDAAQLALPPNGTDDFRVSLALVPQTAVANDPEDEAIYRIVSLDGSKMVRDLTRRDIKSGLWGSYISTKEEYNTWANGDIDEDVLIWTGVTNDVYKTDFIVFRKIPAGTFPFTDKKIPTTISQPYWMSVFEYTQGQYERVHQVALALNYSTKITEEHDDYYRDSWFTNAACAAVRPVDWVIWDDLVGAGYCEWPQEITLSGLSGQKLVGQFRKVTGLDQVTLPTWAEWEHAFHGGTTTDFNNGKLYNAGVAIDNLNALARWKGNAGWTATWNGSSYVYSREGDEPDRNCTAEEGTAPVGSYASNPWGLFDMHGNVMEWVLDRESTASNMLEIATAAGGALVDPVGDPNASKDKRNVCFYAWDSGASMFLVNRVHAAARSKRPDVGGRYGCRLMMPDVTVAAAEREMSEPVVVYTNPEQVQRWCTVKGGETLAMPFPWPEGAVRAEVKVRDAENAELATASADREGLAVQGEIEVTFPTVTTTADERVYRFDIRFFASAPNGGVLVAERTVRLGVVMGYGDKAAKVRPSGVGMRYWRQTGTAAVNVLPLQWGDAPLTIDGTPVDTGLNGAAGWYEWRPSERRKYQLGYGDGTIVDIWHGEVGFSIRVK